MNTHDRGSSGTVALSHEGGQARCPLCLADEEMAEMPERPSTVVEQLDALMAMLGAGASLVPQAQQNQN